MIPYYEEDTGFYDPNLKLGFADERRDISKNTDNFGYLDYDMLGYQNS